MAGLWKNKNGTADRTCSCGTWKNHWLNFSDERWPNECVVYRCKNQPVLGGHIIKLNGDKSEWIAPMCAACNKRTDSFELNSGMILVSANVSKTCGK